MELKNSVNKKLGEFLILNMTILFSVGIFFLISCGSSEDKQITKKKAPSAEIDPQKLAGSWLRPDGGYILELKDIRDDGEVSASYYNPKPINVAESNWRWHETRLQVFVKFDDVNYTGSTYTLEYLPAQDRLVGNYYQAVMKQNYTVEFVRK